MWDVWIANETAKAFYEAIGARRYDDVFAMTPKGEALAALAGEGDDRLRADAGRTRP